jgi:hypothetical protein
MTLSHLPSIPEIEGFVVQVIALILLVLAGAKLVLHEWKSLKSKKGRIRPAQRRKTSQDSIP